MVIIKNDFLTAEIEEVGAQLVRLASTSTDYLWNESPDIWKRHAPILFPFVGRLKEQKYLYKGKEYGPIDNHGFAPTALFAPIEQTSTSVTMQMIVSDDIRKIWPFDFSFLAVYELENASLKITYVVKNIGANTMPYGIGNHPGFNVPLKKGLSFEDYYIEFPEAGQIEKRLFGPGCLDTETTELCKETVGNRLNLRHNLFDNDAIVLMNTGSRAVLKSEKDSKKVIVDYPDCPYCAFWHKVQYPAPYVCIEPWVSMPGRYDEITDIEKKPDFVNLKQGETSTHHLNITIVEN